jgi:hypothetical protein
VAKTQILDYYIHLRDRATAERLQAALEAGDSTPTPTGPGGLLYIPATTSFAILRAPDGAAIEFGALDTPAGVLPLIGPTEVAPTTGAGYISSAFFGTSDSFQTDVATFQRSNGWWIFGGTTRFYWAGHIVYSPVLDIDLTPAGEEATERAVIATRQRLVAFSAIGLGEFASDNGNEGSAPSSFSRDAARHIEGMGMALRANGTGTDNCQITCETGVLTGWSRGYIRARRLPTGAVEIYSVNMAGGSSGMGFSVDILASGQLALYVNADTSSHNLVEAAADAVPLNEWQKLDILTFVQAAANVGTIKVYLRGVLLFSSTLTLGGVEASRMLQNHQWGRGFASGGSDLYLDIDDVMQAAAPKDKDITIAAWASGTDYAINSYARQSSINYRAVVASGPGNGGAVTPGTNSAVWIKQADSVDWLHGSTMVVIKGLSAGADQAGWTGDERILAQLGDQSGNLLSSSTSGAVIDLVTDAEEVLPRPGALGLAALEVVGFARQATAGEGDLGSRYAGGAAVDAAVNVGSVALAFVSTRRNLTTTADPAAIDAIRLRYVKAANTNAATVSTLIGIVEVIGTFGPEDIILADEDEEEAEEALQPVPIGRTLHNCHWPQSPWAASDYALGPVVVIGGTYTGNALAQDIAFPVPPAWIFLRPVTGGAGTVMLCGAELEPGHSLYQLGFAAGTMVLGYRQNHAYAPVSEDADQQMEFLLRVGGSNAQFNANAVVYQYIAFCDPAARFARAGAVSVNTTLAVPFVHALEDPGFTPEWAFFMREDGGGATTASMYTKGAGHAADAASLMTSGASIASAITFAAGQLSLGTGVVATGLDQNNYVLFRRADGNDDPDQAKVMAVGTYTGDGTASRTISLPTTGLRPLWAIVQPVTGAVAIVRDPSHTTNTSQTVNSASTTATGITAGGIDSFSVGSSLNANGVVYNYLLFFASATAGNGGWGTNGVYVPVTSDSLFPPDWDEPVVVDEPEEPAEEPDANDPGELTTDIAANCLSASTRLVNIALSRIGVTARLTSLATDESVEADQARLIYKTEIDATLRAFPWPFATAYADLVHEGGVDADDPVNGDWTHSFRLPADSVFARRIVKPALKRGEDPDPIPFRTFADEDRQLLYTDEPGVQIAIEAEWEDEADYVVELEYTKRIDCPASRGDAVFRSCAAWRLAAALAVALGKDPKEFVRCMQMFASELPRAEVVSSREQTHQHPGDVEPNWIRGR